MKIAPRRNPAHPHTSPSETIQSLLVNFRGSLILASGLRHATATIQLVRRFVWHSAAEYPRQITATSVEAYLIRLAERGRSPKTLRNHRSALSTFCCFLVGRGRMVKNPCSEVQLRKPDETLPRYLEQAEIDLVMRIARAEGIWPEVCLALSTGLRLSELIRLRWLDIDVARRQLAVRKSKSHRPRVVPLSDAALSALAMQRPITGGTGLQPVFTYIFPARQTWRGGWRYVDRLRASSWWLRALKPIQAAVPKFLELSGKSTGRGWHLFRHTFASRAAQRGVSLYKIASWLGHSDVRTTRMYAHLQVKYDADIEAASPTPP